LAAAWAHWAAAVLYNDEYRCERDFRRRLAKAKTGRYLTAHVRKH
jgi:hypothetical protein